MNIFLYLRNQNKSNLVFKVILISILQVFIPFNSHGLDKNTEFSEISNKVYSYKKLETELKQLSSKNHLMKLEVIGKTFENRNIYLVRLGAKSPKRKTRILSIFAQHAEEHDTTLLAMDLIRNILRKNELNKYLEEVEVCIIPMTNPDGVEFDIFNNQNKEFYWRKNRNNLGNNTFGVDLNRNWSFKWNSEMTSDFKNTILDTNSNRYSGEKAFSENETQSIKKFLTNNKTQLFLDYHSGLSTFNQGMIIIPYTYTENETINKNVKALYKELTDTFAQLVSDNQAKREGFVVLQTQDNKPYLEKKLGEIVPKEHLAQALKSLPASFKAPGSSIDYTFGELGILSIGLEVSRDIDFYKKYNVNTFEYQLKGFEYLIDYVKNNYKVN